MFKKKYFKFWNEKGCVHTHTFKTNIEVLPISIIYFSLISSLIEKKKISVDFDSEKINTKCKQFNYFFPS